MLSRTLRKEHKRRQASKKRELKWQLILAARDFVDGLKKQKISIGSLNFNCTIEEQKIIEQVCRYYGYKIVRTENVLCGSYQCENKFYVLHYVVKKL